MSSTSIHVTDLIPVVVTILSETQIPQGRKKKKNSYYIENQLNAETAIVKIIASTILHIIDL